MADPPDAPATEAATSDAPVEVPANYPAHWEFDAVLSDGGTVHVRPVRPDDAARIEAFHGRQSRESIYFRYFSPMPRLGARELARVVNVDYVSRLALVALLGDEIVGVASYDTWHDRNEAEVAFIVDDAHHGRGLATVLLEYLLVAARENGFDGLTAQVLPSNRKMLGVFHQVGFQVSSAFDEGVVEVHLGLEPTDRSRDLIAQREQRAEAASVARLLSPRSIAVIGAGRERGGIGHEVFRSLLGGGFEGPVYPVNPAGGHVASVRAHASILDVPDEVDLAIVAVPAANVLEVVDECGAKRVEGLLIISAGFDQLPDGTERRIVERARSVGMRVIGPESMGALNTDGAVSLFGTFADVSVRAGRVGFLTQSGTLGIAALEHAHRLGVGISAFVDVGAKLDVSGNDLLQYWAADDRTAVVALFLESFGNPRKFTRIARSVARSKPIVAVKSGLTRPPRFSGGPEGLSAAWPTDATVAALLAQSGVIRVDTAGELFDVARVLERQPVPAGRRVAVVSNARGASVLAADACIGAGLATPELAPATFSALEGVVPAGARLANPLELTWEAGPEAYEAAVGAVVADPGVDAVIVVYAPPVRPERHDVARAVAQAAAGSGKPVVATFLGTDPGTDLDGGEVLPLFRFPSEAAQVLGRIAGYGEWLARPVGNLPEPDELGLHIGTVRQMVAEALDGRPEGRWLQHDEASALLAAAGIEVCATEVVHDADGAVAAAERLGYPLVVKATDVGRYHRGEASGVALDLRDPEAVRAVYERMRASLGAAMEPALVQQMAGPGADVLVVGHQHPSFGAVLSIGLGGSVAFATSDLPVRVLPLSDTDATALVDASPVRGVLAGEGADGAARGAMEHFLVRLAALMEHVPEISDVMLNPVIVGDGGAAVTDAWIRLAPYRVDALQDVRRLS
ncbi:bifunctional GNAT family N-acetyltransferase/acetate--CoA ligase family protein [Rhabdothermincola salaria]|uniref:bifunctional acetate--CoA ligase family protein/GNAT family N-acetyltransferase n=1 Tax=Rhabdothermincola salaria TaxID=2903142 RepID=UPI001E39CC9E|nr:bifunctional GNAT family N-acetyltransferase/acetate--CoA ligase family protein [Rhabdothermincola salaria]MCD9622337.1 GNAT family N-acetyltransferase [Rhabdothermincola salaria]